MHGTSRGFFQIWILFSGKYTFVYVLHNILYHSKQLLQSDTLNPIWIYVLPMEINAEPLTDDRFIVTLRARGTCIKG